VRPASCLWFYAALVGALALLVVSCNSPSAPEDVAAQFIGKSEKAFEERDIRSLKKLISPTYLDAQKRSAGDIMSIAAAYIRSSKSIYLFTTLDSAENVEGRIEARLLAAFTARPISDMSVLGRIQADIYWFDIVIAPENGVWKLVAARWQQAMIDDFFKEGEADDSGAADVVRMEMLFARTCPHNYSCFPPVRNSSS
jgi:hypothetical protein